MYLRSDERELGKENFFAAIGSEPVRRKFLKEAVQKEFAPRKGLGGYYFKYTKVDKPLIVGVLGVGEQGRRLIAAINPAFITVKSIADLRPSSRRQAISGDDVPLTADEKKKIDALTISAEEKKKRKGTPKADPNTGLVNVYKGTSAKDFKQYSSYQELLAAAKTDGVEAVIIALPSHLHATASLAAMEAGLHVFVEPPMALSVRDAKAMAVKASQGEKKLCLAVGHQRRYSMLYDNALELLRKGVMDDVHYLRAQWHLKKDEKTPQEKEEERKAAKKDERKINWWREVAKEDQGLKLADHGYESVEQLVRWQVWEKFSGGLLMELGCHLFDAAAQFMASASNRSPQQDYPMSVAASASRLMPDLGGDVDDHVYCVFEYQAKDYVEKGFGGAELPQKSRKKIGLQYDMIVGNDFDAYGETVLGKQGSLVLEREQDGLLYNMSGTDKKTRVLPKKDKDGKPLPGQCVLENKDAAKTGDPDSAAVGQLALSGIDPGFIAELEHWAWCVRNPATENKPRGDALTGLAATVLAAAAAQAVKTGLRINFQKEWFDPKSEKTPEDIKAAE